MTSIRDMLPNDSLLGSGKTLVNTLRESSLGIAKHSAKLDATCNGTMSSIMATLKRFTKEDDPVNCRPAGQQWPVCTP